MNIYVINSKKRCSEYDGFVISCDSIERACELAQESLYYPSEKENFSLENIKYQLVSTTSIYGEGIILSSPVRTDW